MSSRSETTSEWLEADGLGGFASGTASGIRTRRYHALLLAATTPPTGRVVLVNGIEAWVRIDGRDVAISSQRYTPDVTHPDGASRVVEFVADPWPRWTYDLGDGIRLHQEIVVPHERSAVVLRWSAEATESPLELCVRPLISGRDYHALHRENPVFRFDPVAIENGLVWRPYDGIPEVRALFDGRYEHAPTWYRGFQYDEERERGLDFVEDLASPGMFRLDLSSGSAELILVAAVNGDTESFVASGETVGRAVARTIESERVRRPSDPLARARDAYFVRRRSGRTIVAGYPWFTDWGRDTFIALRGLAIDGGARLDDAGDILVEWSEHVSEGMLPNLFPDGGAQPEYNSVDASLWYAVAVADYLATAARLKAPVDAWVRDKLLAAVDAILDGYARGTRFGIRATDDGLLACGVPGVQLTWMDAKVGDWVVTPRIGKPVEVQALWLAALAFGAERSKRWQNLYERARQSFTTRFWNDAAGCLYDVVDVDHIRGAVDPSIRPNQILAVGGLPVAAIEGERARRVVEVVESRLLAPLGLRSLAPSEGAYVSHYGGGVRERDGAYHQGTVWPWLIGPFVDAWLNVHGDTAENRADARRRFVSPLLGHLHDAGLGHVSEIADADPPHTPRGCPFQAWSLGELLRARRRVGAPEGAARRPRPERKPAAAPRARVAKRAAHSGI